MPASVAIRPAPLNPEHDYRAVPLDEDGEELEDYEPTVEYHAEVYDRARVFGTIAVFDRRDGA